MALPRTLAEYATQRSTKATAHEEVGQPAVSSPTQQSIPQWEQILSSENFAALPDDRKEHVRQSYFNDFVAPNVDVGQLETVRASFDADTNNMTPTLGDVGRGIMVGFAGLGGAVGQGLEFVGADEVGAGLRGLSDRAAEYWRDGMTPAGRAAASAPIITDDVDLGPMPVSSTVMQAAQSLPSMAATIVPGGLAAKGISALGGKTLAKAAARQDTTGAAARIAPTAVGYGAAEGGVAGLQNAAHIHSEIAAIPIDQLRQMQPFQDALATLPHDMPLIEREVRAREVLAENAASDVALKTAASTGGIGMITGGGVLGQIGRKAGHGTAQGVAKDSLLKSVSKGAASEFIQEAPQSGAEELIQNQAMRDHVDPNTDVSEGVVSSALSGAVVGGVLGAGGGLYNPGPKGTIGEQDTSSDISSDEDVGLGTPAATQPPAPTFATEPVSVTGPAVGAAEYTLPAAHQTAPTPPGAVAPTSLDILQGAAQSAPVETNALASQTPDISADILGKSGQPFKTQKSATFHAKAKKLEGYAPVNIGVNQWALRKETNAQNPETQPPAAHTPATTADMGAAIPQAPQPAAPPAPRKPDGLDDPRILRDAYRGALGNLVSDLTRGGGVSLVPREGAKPRSDTGDVTYDYDSTDLKRTPSVNPAWFQSLAETTGVTVDQAKNAVGKALRGDKLGVRQARVVQSMLDVITGERTAPDNLEAARRFRQQARGNLTALTDHERYAEAKAGDLLDEQEYLAEWDAPTRALGELIAAANAVNPDAAEIVTGNGNISDHEAAKRLVKIIEDANDGREPATAQAGREPAAIGTPPAVAGLDTPTPPERNAAQVARSSTQNLDLLGQDTRAQQALADVTRAKDAQRAPNVDVPADIGKAGDMFSTGANSQTDMVDAAKSDRRQDAATRKRIADMSPDEMRRALLTSDLTGLSNRRAYDESAKKPIQTPDRQIELEKENATQESIDTSVSNRTQNLARDEEALQQPERQGIQKLRGPGYQSLPEVGKELQRVPGGFGAETQRGNDAGESGQRRELRAVKRALGKEITSKQKQKELSQNNGKWKADDGSRGKQTTGNTSGNDQVQNQEGFFNDGGSYEGQSAIPSARQQDTERNATASEGVAAQPAEPARGDAVATPPEGVKPAPSKKKKHASSADLPEGWTLEEPPLRQPEYRVVIRNEKREEVAYGPTRAEAIARALGNVNAQADSEKPAFPKGRSAEKSLQSIAADHPTKDKFKSYVRGRFGQDRLAELTASGEMDRAWEAAHDGAQTLPDAEVSVAPAGEAKREESSAEKDEPSKPSIMEGSPLYSGYERDQETLQSRQRDARRVQETDGNGAGQYSLFDTQGLPTATATAQAADNFLVRYTSVPVGDIRVGVDKISTPEEAAHVMSFLRKHAQETFAVLVTDADGNILNLIRHTKGLKDSASVDALTVAGAIVATDGAAQVWYGHNHPSGDPEPSSADRRLTIALDGMLDGTDIQSRGHVIVGVGASAYYFDKDGWDSPIRIKPLLRKRAISLTERVIRKQPPASRLKITSPKSAIDIIQLLRAENAILLLDNKHQVSGVVALSPQEMSYLRRGGRVKRLLRAIDTTNASAALIASADKDAARNAARFLNKTGIRVLDAIVRENGALVSSADKKLGVETDSGAWFSRQGKVTQSSPRGLPVADARAVAERVVSRLKLLGRFGVEVHESRNGLPPHIKAQAEREGADDVRAAYDPKTNTVHLISSELTSPREIEEAILHEAYGHYGARKLFGKDLKRAFNTLHLKLGGRAGLKALADRHGINLDPYLNTARAALDKGAWTDEQAGFYLADELLALMQGKQASESLVQRAVRAVQEFIGAVRDILRKRGFAELSKVSDADLAFLLRKMAEAARGKEKAVDDDGRPVFARGTDTPGAPPEKRDRKNIDTAMRRMGKLIDEFAAGTLKESDTQILGDTPAVLQALGAKPLAVQIDGKVVIKALRDKHRHSMTPDIMKQMPEGLYDPLAVFDSPDPLGRPGKLVLTELRDRKGDPVIVAVHLDKDVPRAKVNKIASVYELENAGARLQKKRLEYFRNERSLASLRSLGFATTTGMVQTEQGLKAKVLTEADIVKTYGPAFSRGGKEDTPDAPTNAKDRIAGRVYRTPKGDFLWTGKGWAVASGKADVVDRVRQDANTSAWQRVRDKAADWTPKLLGAITLQQLTDIGAKHLPQMRGYAKAVNKMQADMNAMQQSAAEVAERWAKWSRANRPAAKRLAELMHDATIAGVDPAEGFVPADIDALKKRIELLKAVSRSRPGEDQSNRIEEMNYLKGRIKGEPARADAYEVMRARWAMLPNEAQHIYREVRDSYLRQADSMLEALQQRIQASDASEAVKRRLMDKLRLHFEQARVEAPYFPLARFGEYWAEVVDAKGERQFIMFDSAGERRDTVNQLQKEGHTLVKQGRKEEMSRAVFGTSSAFMTEVNTLLDQVGGNKADEFKDALYQLYLQQLPPLSMRKAFVHRKKVSGFSQDALRAYAHKMFHGASQIARLRHSADMEKLIADMQGVAKEAPDSTKHVALINELQRRHEWVLNPTDSGLANMLTSLGFVWYLGAGVSSALVNLTQTPVVAFPILGAKFGAGKASAALLSASKDVVSKNLSKRERDMLDVLEKAGVIDRTMAHDLAGIGDTPSGAYSDRRARAMRIVSFMFHHAERFNRESTALAAYRLAGGGKDAIEYAKTAVQQAHFDYSNANRARWMQSNTAKVLLLFKQYALNMTYHLWRNVYLATKDESPEVRAESRKILLGTLGMTGLLSGATGLPLFGVMMGVANAVAAAFGDDDEWDAEREMYVWLKEHFGKDGADRILRGPTSDITGADIASRSSLNGLWLRAPEKELEGKAYAHYLLEQAAGPVAGGLLISQLRGIQLIGEGHTDRGIEAMTPKFVRDGLRAFRYADEGALSMRDDPLVDKFSAWELALQASGFTPERLAEQYDANSRVKSVEQMIMDKRAALLTAFALAVKAGEEQDRDTVLQKIQQFNQRHPGAAISGSALSRSVLQRARLSAQADGGIITNRRLGGELETFR